MFAAFLDIEIPILQAPIGGASVPALCAAVSEAGGMGGLALSWTEPEAAKKKISSVLALTHKPFYVNFALAFEPKALPCALEAGARIVTFSWGMPTSYVGLVRGYGAKLGIQVANRDGALRALDLGANFLICQGLEAGGHVQSTTSLIDLLPVIVEVAGEVPVVASGGIATGAAIANVLGAGARAVSIGTLFLATQESAAHSEYKALLSEENSMTTALTGCFDIGWPLAAHRVLRNTTLETWEAAGRPGPGQRPGEGEIVAFTSRGEPVLRYEDTQPLSGTSGRIEEMCLYAGTGVSEIHDVPPAAELLTRIWIEARDHLARASANN